MYNSLHVISRSVKPFASSVGSQLKIQLLHKLYRMQLACLSESKMMSYIFESCPLTKLSGSLSRLHSADEDAVSWLTIYG